MKVGTDAVLLGAWAFATVPDADSPIRILDVGCGTGVLALMMAQRFPCARIVGVELDSEATAEAAYNKSVSPWHNRIEIVNADFLEFTQGEEDFDLIISNPPFFSNGELAPDILRSLARHEGGLNFNTLIAKASLMLKPSGRLAVVAPHESRGRLIEEAAMARLYPQRECAVTTVSRKPPRRVLMEFGCQSACTTAETLIIHAAGGDFSNEYRNLTKEFYLHF